MRLQQKNHLAILLTMVLVSAGNQSFSQEIFGVNTVKVYNFETFIFSPKDVSTELLQYTDPAVLSHPEFGKLPYNTQCIDCFELIEKRTANTRYFMGKNSNGTKHYTQASYNDLHFLDTSGLWLTIDPHLEEGKDLKVFKASQQPNPTKLDFNKGYTSIRMWDGQEFIFNEDLKCYSTSDFTTKTKTQYIDLTNYTVGNDGAQIFNAFSQVTQQLIYGKGSIKSNYLLNDLSSVDTGQTYYVIEDQFSLPKGYILKYDKYAGDWNVNGNWNGELVLENENGIEMARILPPLVFDAAEFSDGGVSLIAGYQIEQKGQFVTLRIILDVASMNHPDRVFPITIDPTVFGTTETWTGIAGSNESPSWCSVTISVPTPPEATLTGSSVYWEFVATGDNCPPSCRMNDLQVRLSTECGASPGGAFVWICPGCNAAGTWYPTIDDATTAGLVSCAGPSCTSFDIDFKIEFNQFNCVTPGGCVISCAYLQEFMVTIEGETVVTTAIADGATTYTVTDCVDQSGWLNPTGPYYGVPGYTYNWMPIGYSGDSVYVTWPLGTTLYTLTITDACGNTAVDNVTVINNCATLDLDLLSFSASYKDEAVHLYWESATSDLIEQFIVERSTDGINFEKIGAVAVDDKTNHIFGLEDPIQLDGIIYYRLEQLDVDGNSAFSEVISLSGGVVSPFEIISAQSIEETGTIELTIRTKAAGLTNLLVYDAAGNMIVSEEVYLQEGMNVSWLKSQNFSKGMLIVKASQGQLSDQERIVW